MKFTSIFFTASASILEIHLKDRDLFWKCKEKQRGCVLMRVLFYFRHGLHGLHG